ncbi:DUF1673 domain-containing protein [Methanosarcina sp. Z-7115]|uniref:DUF1673 domain-containing protein n=1 Tax=Methanosarcina baikalica TaxID=3073890 RepID=A0ABU2D2L9_9EURY|nr:DUF1673 domain-containing protein [Methanosarcina sp. Z-7115]MDR7666230.1 DUF1673 domain-containing protein [Methanosarcina sp. Z-7115]
MPAKIFVFERIKKLMGWCPNAKAHETRRHVSPENFDSYVPDRARDDNIDLKTPGWLRRISNQILLFAIFLTFVHLLIYNQIGLNFDLTINLLTGSIPALSYFVFYWNERIQRFNDIAKKPVVRYVSKVSYLWILIIIILLILLMVLSYLIRQSWHSALFGLSIILFLTWGFYFQLIYWEKKNRMKIYIKYENSFEKTYAIREKEGEK